MKADLEGLIHDFPAKEGEIIRKHRRSMAGTSIGHAEMKVVYVEEHEVVEPEYRRNGVAPWESRKLGEIPTFPPRRRAQGSRTAQSSPRRERHLSESAMFIPSRSG